MVTTFARSLSGGDNVIPSTDRMSASPIVCVAARFSPTCMRNFPFHSKMLPLMQNSISVRIVSGSSSANTMPLSA